MPKFEGCWGPWDRDVSDDLETRYFPTCVRVVPSYIALSRKRFCFYRRFLRGIFNRATHVMHSAAIVVARVTRGQISVSLTAPRCTSFPVTAASATFYPVPARYRAWCCHPRSVTAWLHWPVCTVQQEETILSHVVLFFLSAVFHNRRSTADSAARIGGWEWTITDSILFAVSSWHGLALLGCKTKQQNCRPER